MLKKVKKTYILQKQLYAIYHQDITAQFNIIINYLLTN